ncbi:NAD(P)H-dependent oxidoreductase [Blautia marasmi]|nr:NAD(P)H-dependent oxidoreductase [Blautia marasmi]MCQ4644649.1 NAD(P)H-dependent oxidoreductase [Blautia marasmi]MCQ4979428.1 NAD(P)H-dependent oxidoreductase [Blautia producta]
MHPCKGCEACGMSGPCAQKDDMAFVRKNMLETDLAVFVTPLYYFGLSAQMKMVIDRFYSFNGALTARGLKSVLLAAAWNTDDWTMKDIKSHYMTLCSYLNFRNQGMVLGTGCGTPAMTKRTQFPQEAYELGKRIGG